MTGGSATHVSSLANTFSSFYHLLARSNTASNPSTVAYHPRDTNALPRSNSDSDPIRVQIQGKAIMKRTDNTTTSFNKSLEEMNKENNSTSLNSLDSTREE
jgi:hypothetical protein